MAEEPVTTTKKKRPPAKTAEAREKELISLAMDLAEQKLRDGTASNQIIQHFLQAGSTTENLNRLLKAEDTKLKSAKTAAIEADKDLIKMYSEAMKAMTRYQGGEVEEDE